MALLLRRTVSSAAKSGSRRRLSPFVKSNHAIRGKDSWFVSVERSFWYRDAMSPFATTARSTLTSYRDQEEEQQNYQASEKNPSLLLPSKLNINSSGPTWRGREYPQGSRYMSTDTRSSTHNSFRGRVNHFHCSRAGIVRYTPPPASIRTTLGWSQCIAAERAATDLAIRALNTWTNQYQNNLLDAFQQQNTGSSRKKNHQVAFFSTNFDGGPNRDQYNHIARTGIRKSKIPTPESGESQRSMKPEDVLNEINKKSKTVVLPAIVSASKAVMMFLLRLPFNTIYYMIHPAKAREKWDDMKQFIKEEVDHYWVGTKVKWSCLILFCLTWETKNKLNFSSSHIYFCCLASLGRLEDGTGFDSQNFEGIFFDTTRTKAAAAYHFRSIPACPIFHVFDYSPHGICAAVCS